MDNDPSKQVRRRSSSRSAGEDAVIEAAWLYYHEGKNQNEIARLLNVSRPTVVNYLQSARDRGYVRISLADEAFVNHQTSIALKERFSLAGVYLVPDPEDANAALHRVARGAGEWLPTLLKPGDRLGVAWGQTIFSVAEAMPQVRTRDVSVLQLVGSMATPYGFTAEICSAHLAQRLSARCINLHAPAVLSSTELAAHLRAEPLIKAQLDAVNNCNKTIFAAGSIQPDSHVVSSGVATRDELGHYIQQGAAGVLCGQFIDKNGKPIKGSLNDRMIGVDLETMTGLDVGLLVSVGTDKVAPMLAAIRGGYVTHVVTSRETAEQMLATA
ncbi:MAG: sugar-binding transcriptional regulator [Stappiaceae bacterium]